MAKPVPKKRSGYLHGYSGAEQDRLYRQAELLEETVYSHVDFSATQSLIEVGCGVGAQTAILLKRFPHLKITGLDYSDAQLARAKTHLKKELKAGKVKLVQGDAAHLPFADNSFDGAFVCWFLEHVADPIGVLKELRRVLKPGSRLVCSEVLNASFFVHPYSPALLQYWFAFNDHQWNLKGDPFVGAKLANYLLAAGYQAPTTRVVTYHYDNRAPKHRAQFVEEWTDQLLSGASELLKAKRVTSEIVEEMKRELKRLEHDPDAVFFNSWVQAHATAL